MPGGTPTGGEVSPTVVRVRCKGCADVSENLRKLIGVAVMAAIVVVGVVATNGDDSDFARTRNNAFGLPKGAGLDAQVQQPGDAELDLTRAMKAAAKCDAGRVLISTGDPIEPWRCGPPLIELATVVDENRRPKQIGGTSGAAINQFNLWLEDSAPCRMVHALGEASTGHLFAGDHGGERVSGRLSQNIVRLSEQKGMIARVSCIGDLAAGTAQRDLVRIFQDIGFRNVAADGSWSDWNSDVRVRIEVNGQTGLVQQVFMERVIIDIFEGVED